MDPQLVDRIYECAFVPELWPDVLGELAVIAGAHLGYLYTSNGEQHYGTASLELARRKMNPSSGNVWRTKRVECFYSMQASGFVREIDHDFVRHLHGDQLWSEVRKIGNDDPVYRDHLFPRGLGWATGTILHLPTDDRLCMTMEREWARGPVEDRAVALLDKLRPHLARAAYMSARLQLAQAGIASQTLGRLGLATAVVDGARRVMAANELIERQAGFIRWRARDRFNLTDSRADTLLSDALDAIETTDAVRSFPVRDTDGEPALVAHVIPIRRAAQDIFSRCSAALVLTPVTAPGAPPVELVRSLFDLTPSEARVARELASGKTVDDSATDGGVALSTVRTHLRRVLEKTGCSRQAEAVALLGGISPIRSLAP